MATRIKDWMIPYTGGIGIEITNNHVINVLLREMNNLIHYTGEDDPEYDGPKELYVDLQLPAWITPEDDLPVWVTVWEILEEDWWQQSGTMLNWKTTSWDWVRIIYANDDTLYYDPWTGVWIPFLTGDKLDVATASKLWVIKLWSDTKQTEPAQNPTSAEGRTYPVQLNANNQAMVNVPWEDTTYESLPEENWWTDLSLVTTGEKYIWNRKQDKLTAWDNITIDANNRISANITAMTFKGSVPDYSSLPTTWNNVWDVWVIEDRGIAYCWDGTDWVSLGSFIDLSNYFNKTIDDSDNIIQWSLNLFVTPAEKIAWNNKQDKIIAGRNISIGSDGRTINNTCPDLLEWNWIELNTVTDWLEIENSKPFDPENEWVLSQVLKRTSTWYRWADEVDWFDPENEWARGMVLKKTSTWYKWETETVTSVNWQTWDVLVTEFDPQNAGTTWQVLKKTATWYKWQNESWWWGWGWGGQYYGWEYISVDSNNYINNDAPFIPATWWQPWQVLGRTENWYDWLNISSGECVKFWNVDTDNLSQALMKEITDWIAASANNWAILYDSNKQDVFIYSYTNDHVTEPTQTVYAFLWVKRSSYVYNSQHGDYTTARQWKLQINYVPWEDRYYKFLYENYDDSTITNYLSVMGSWYVTPFMPTEQYQPATKQYVDATVIGGWLWVLWITQNTTWTNIAITQEWVGTQAQYNAIQPVQWVVYNIID